MTQNSSPQVCGCLCAPMGHSHQHCEGYATPGLTVPLTDRQTDQLVPACEFCFGAVRRRLWNPRRERLGPAGMRRWPDAARAQTASRRK